MWRKFLNMIAFAVTVLGWMTAATAQNAPDPEARMAAASALEHTLLLERDRLLAMERDLEDPIWAGQSYRDARVYSAAQMRANLTAIARASGLRDLDSNRFPPAAAFIIEMAREAELGPLNTASVDRAMGILRALAPGHRQVLLHSFDQAISEAREEFAAAQADRDRAETAGGPDSPYAGASVSGGFAVIRNAGIPGHNRQIETLPLAACLDLCRELSWCITVDFERAENQCFLQPVSGQNVDINYDYDNDPYDHYALIERLTR